MSERSPEQKHDQIRALLDSLYRVDSGRILATLIRLLGDFDLAEEAMHEAFAAALSLWPSLIDEYRFVVMPIIAGEGRRLFEGVNLPEKLQLKLVETKTFKSGCVALRYLKQ